MIWYLQLNLSILLFGMLAIFISNWNISSLQKVKTHIMLLLFSFLVLPTIHLIPEAGYQYPTRELIQIPMTVVTQTVNFTQKSFIDNQGPFESSTTNLSQLILLTVLLLFLRLIWQTYLSLRTIKKAFLYKKIGRLELLITDNNVSPYSFSFLQKSYVVLPNFLLTDLENLKLATKHELQHLRHQDTFWIYVFEIAKTLAFINPIFYLWKKQFLLDQEFACDEALIAQKKVSPRAYVTCLMQVAEKTCFHNIPFGTAGMAWGQIKPQILRRVIQMKKVTNNTKSIFSKIVALSLIFFTISVFALQTPIGTLTKSQLQKLINPKDFNDFPVEINDQVVKEVNYFLSDKKWKSYTQESLKRYKNHKDMINKTAAKYNLPPEIAAIAFIESGFENLPDRTKSISTTGAGMWQFIPQTARNYGLKVDGNVDERLDVQKATDAAMRYLSSNNAKFNDLRFAMMGYYLGEDRVQNDMLKFHTQDPWTLIEKANYNTPYLARAIAASIILKYPNFVK